MLKRGEVFSHSDLNESVRNLRRLGVFSLVAAVPVLTNDPDTVGIFLVTRDLWSLRLESSFQLTGGVLDRFQSQLTERNLFWRGIQALVRYNMQPLFVSTGALFNNRRVMGKPYTLQVSTDAFFERKTGDYEGYNVTVYGARPFYTMNDRFSYGVSVSRGQGVVRQEQMGSRIYWDDAETDETESIPRSWAYTSYALSAFGDVQYRYSTVFRLGGGLSVSNYEVEAINSESLNAVSDESRDDSFQRSFRRVSCLLIRIFEHHFIEIGLVFKNLSSFALSEELQLGFSGSIYGQFPTQALGSTQDLVIAGGYLVFREKLFKDALLEFAVSGRSSYRSALER